MFTFIKNKKEPKKSLISIFQVGKSGLVTIAGGKWTTYRHMAEETVDTCIKVGFRYAIILITIRNIRSNSPLADF